LLTFNSNHLGTLCIATKKEYYLLDIQTENIVPLVSIDPQQKVGSVQYIQNEVLIVKEGSFVF
jgi:hypothetical protein